MNYSSWHHVVVNDMMKIFNMEKVCLSGKWFLNELHKDIKCSFCGLHVKGLKWSVTVLVAYERDIWCVIDWLHIAKVIWGAVKHIFKCFRDLSLPKILTQKTTVETLGLFHQQFLRRHFFLKPTYTVRFWHFCNLFLGKNRINTHAFECWR